MTDDDERQVLRLMKTIRLASWPLVAIGVFGVWATVSTDINSLARIGGLIGSLLCFYAAWVIYSGAVKIIPMLGEAITHRAARKAEWKSKIAEPVHQSSNEVASE